MLSFRSRVRAAFLGLALVGSYAGSVQGGTLLSGGSFVPPRGARAIDGIEVGRLLIRNPQSFGSVPDATPGYSEFPARLGNGQIDALDDHAAVKTAPVSLLGVPVRPTTISGFVVPFTSDSIQRQTCGNFAHVGEEILERRHPSLANGNPARPVEAKFLGLWVVAALLHPAPAIVGPRILGAASVPVRAFPLAALFSGQAAARFGVAAPEFVFLNNGFSAAGAAA